MPDLTVSLVNDSNICRFILVLRRGARAGERRRIWLGESLNASLMQGIYICVGQRLLNVHLFSNCTLAVSIVAHQGGSDILLLD
jgi:hypothetical protein